MTIDLTNNPLEWGSHLPALMACVVSTVGDILELGVGHFSTPVLHAVCKSASRHLTSIESDPKWYKEFSDQYCDKGHDFYYGDYAQLVPELSKNLWSVCLIDNSPGGARRADDFKTLLEVTIYAVVHDYHKDNEEAITPLLENVPYHYVCKRYQPPTLVASLCNPIPPCLLKL